MKRQWLTYLIGAAILLLGIGLLLAVVNPGAPCGGSLFIQNLLVYPDCGQVDALEGLGIALGIVGLLLFVIGFAEPDGLKSAVAIPAPEHARCQSDQ